jgi:hypothetical protein
MIEYEQYKFQLQINLLPQVILIFNDIRIEW